MRVTFVAMGCELLGMESLSTVLENRGHEVSLVFDPSLFDDKVYFHNKTLARIFRINTRKTVNRIIKTKPDIIGFYIIADTFRWTESVATMLKKLLPDTPIICGGIYPTSNPEILIKKDWVDIICLGEGEYPLLELLESMDKGGMYYNIKNLWFKKEGRIIENPMRPMLKPGEWSRYDKSLFEKVIPMHNNFITVTSKGCPYKCSYCSESFLQPIYSSTGRYFVKKGVDDVIEELRDMKKRYNFRFLDIRDNTFTSNKEWVLDFCKKYEKELKKTPFKIMTHPAILDEEMAFALKNAGCFKCQFGVQSLNESSRKNILNRPGSNEKMIRGFEACDKARLPYSIDHIFNIPKETEEDQIKACYVYARCKSLMRITCFWLSYFPQTDIVNIAKKLGELTEEDVQEINNLKEDSFYLDTGSLRDKRKIKMFIQYNILMRAIPLLSQRAIEFILKRRLQRYLRFLPRYITLWIIDILVSIKKRDLEGFTYLRYYLWQFRRMFRELLFKG